MENKLKLLLIGPRTNKKDPFKTGGIIILFEDLLSQCSKHNIDFLSIDTNKANYPNIFLALLSIYFKIFLLSFRASHISLHGTANDYVYIAPFVVFWSKLLRKKSSLRKFAGNFNHYYAQAGLIKKKVIEYVLTNNDFNFFETKYLVNFFKTFNPNTFWFPNVREKNNTVRTKLFEKRFVFISQLYETKGVDEILQVSNLLPEGYIIDLYGPIKDEKYNNSHYFQPYKATYRGALASSEVKNTLAGYDVLILASHYYPGEGYPGIVIEALSIGKPVIVTNLESIREMVDEQCARFVKPQSIEDLKNKILSFNDSNYPEFSANALKCFDQFDSEIQTTNFLNIIMKEKL